jgi:hypothetical protein
MLSRILPSLQDDEWEDDDWREEINVDLYLIFYLKLPSGTWFRYEFGIEIYKNTQMYAITYFDHATESGWYTQYIVSMLKNSYYHNIGVASIIFDPPGGDPGHEPLAMIEEVY